MKTFIVTLSLLWASLALANNQDSDWDPEMVLYKTGIDVSNQPHLKFWKLSSFEKSKYLSKNCLYNFQQKYRLKFYCESTDKMSPTDARCNFNPNPDYPENSDEMWLCPKATTKISVSGTSCWDEGYGYNIITHIDSIHYNDIKLFLGEKTRLSTYPAVPQMTNPMSPIRKNFTKKARIGLYYFWQHPLSEDPEMKLALKLNEGFNYKIQHEENKVVVKDISLFINTLKGEEVLNKKKIKANCYFEDLPPMTIE